MQWEVLPVQTITKATQETSMLLWQGHHPEGQSTRATFRLYHPEEYVVTFKVIKYSFRHLHHAAFQLLKYCKAKEKVKLCCTKPVCYNNILDAHTKLNQPSYRSHTKDSNQLVEFVIQVCACQCPDPLL